MSLKDPFQISQDLMKPGIPISETLLVILVARSMRFVKTGIYCQKSRDAVPIVIHARPTAENRRFCCLVLGVVVPRTVASPRASAAARTS
jgi:hypothetical protein